MPRSGNSGLAGAAGLIAGLTVAARVVGFARIFVFSSMVGLTTLGNIYQTMNTLPNILFEIVAGGALAAVVVPLVATAITAQSSADVNQISSALLTWAVVLLTPLAVLVAVLAHPIADALLGSEADAHQVAVGARMLVVFAPQLVLYGVGIALTGILQAHHRFGWPAVAPLLSSITVMAAYVTFAVIEGRGADIDDVDLLGELVLSVGTTLGVAVLSLCLFVPLRFTGVRLRPTLRFPPGVSARARALLGSGVAAVGGQQVALLVVLILLQPPAPEGAVVAFTLALTVFLLPWAVLAVPVATSAFPRLSAAHAAAAEDTLAATLRLATKATVLLCLAAAAMMVATARPIATVITVVAEGRSSTSEIRSAIVAFAPGLIGYGLFALFSRALYAMGVAKATAIVTVGSWLLVVFADLVLVAVVPANDRVTAMAIGNSIGMTLLGIGLTMLIVRRIGSGGMAGLGRTLGAAVLGALVGGIAGWVSAQYLPDHSWATAVGSGLVAAVVTGAIFAAIVAIVDRQTWHDVRAVRRAAQLARAKEGKRG